MKRIVYLLLVLLSTFGFCYAATVSGYVIEKESGEPIIGAAVGIKGTGLGFKTNKKGYFVVAGIKKGEVEVYSMKMGYKTKSKKVRLDSAISKKFIKIELEKQSVKLKGIKITEKNEKTKVNSRVIHVSNVVQNTEQLKDVVAVAEPDVFRAVLAQPGVTPISDYSSGLYIRGGSPDQNLILLDGIDVYNPTHFGGIFSTFNADAVKNVELHKGGFGAEYGGCLSSVLDVTNRDGNRKEHSGIARISMISSAITMEGPWKIGSEKGSYMASFRRTYLELVKDLLGLDIPDYYFYDGHAKVNWDLNQTDKLSSSVYFGKDRLNFDFGSKLKLKWGNIIWSNQLTKVINPELFSTTILAGSHFYSNFSYDIDTGGSSQYFDRDNEIYDFTAKQNLSWMPVKEHMIDMGIDFKYVDVSFVNKTNQSIDPDKLPDIKVYSYLTSAFIQDSWDITDMWTLQPGLRFAWCRNQADYGKDPDTVDFFRTSPRLSIRRKLNKTSNVYASYGKYYQYRNMISGDRQSPMDLWFPIDSTIPPGESDHYTVGYKSEINETFAFDFELYYKDFKNLVEVRPEIENEWSNETGRLKDALNKGKGYAYGLDVLLRTNYEGLKGFIGYTYGVTKRKVKNYNTNPETGNEEYFYPKYDRTHQINIVESYSLLDAFDITVWGSDMSLAVTYAYGTGQPTSQPEHLFYDPDTSQMQQLSSYVDSYRLPNYSRLDIGVKMNYEHETYSIEPYLQIINVLNKENIDSRTYYTVMEKDPETEETKLVLKYEDQYQFPLIPFIGVNVKW